MQTKKNYTNQIPQIFVFVLFCFSCLYTKTTFSLCGDVSGDNQILSNDVLMVARASIGILTLTDAQKARADVVASSSNTPDGQILSNDLLIVARASLGMITPLCNENRKPTISSTAVATATVSTPYTYDVNATDADNDTLTYSLTMNPTGMTINSTTGLISWIPVAEGTFSVVTSVSDGKSGVATQGWTITVSSPVISTTVSKVSAGDYYTCAVLSDNTIKCWGVNWSGRLGITSTVPSDQCSASAGGPATYCSTTPVTTSGITNAVTVSAGYSHTCAVLSDNTVKCWGNNDYGQLGTGFMSPTYSSTPVSVKNITNASSISNGGNHTCIALLDNTVKCWGKNYYGQLGNGNATNSSTAVSVSGISNAVSITTGGGHTCAVLSNNTIKCWGYNAAGQIGNGTTDDSSIPVTVIGINNALSVSAGGNHTCAVLSDNTIKCWGSNFAGQLGNSITDDSSIPVTVSGINNALSVSVGAKHTCAVLSDGTAKCWGSNSYGQLGNRGDTWSDYSTPVTVNSINNALSISAGDTHTCAVLSDGTVKCWGDNRLGELGIGSSKGINTCTMNAMPCSVTPVLVVWP